MIHSDRRDVALYPKKERKLWIWIAVSYLTGRILAPGLRRGRLKVGSRGAKPLKRLWARIKALNPHAVLTDEWRTYRKVIPAHLLIQSKRFTWPVESVNSRVRHYLARFTRKTFCYSKSPHMAELSIYCLFWT